MAATLTLPRRLFQAEEPEWIVWLLVIVLLAAGTFLKISRENQTQTFEGAGVSFNYPADWVQLAVTEEAKAATTLLYAGDPFSSAQVPTSIAVQRVSVAQVGRNLTSLNDVALAWSTQQARDQMVYQTLSLTPATIGGTETVQVDYAYLPQTVAGSLTSIPVVARAQDFLILQNGTVTVITLTAKADTFETNANLWQHILESVTVQ